MTFIETGCVELANPLKGSRIQLEPLYQEITDRYLASIESITAQVADAYADKQKIPVTDAMRMFMTTKTYELLTNPKSYLYLESAAYVEDMLNAELSGDWESWMEV